MAKEINIKAKLDTDQAEKGTESLSKKLDKLIDTQNESLKTQKQLGKETKDSLDSATGATGKLSKGFKGVGLAIKAAGIGILIGILAELQALLSQNQKVTDLFTTAFNALSTVVNDFIEFITGGNLLDKVGGFFKALIDDPLAAIGGAIDGVKEYAEETIKAAEANTKLANSARIAAAEQQRLIERYDRQAELQRQIRDDEDVALEDRIEANNKLGNILNKQIQQEIALVDIRVKSAQANVDQNNSIDNQVALIEALTEKDAILARVEGQRSEQLINRTSLQRQLNEQLALEAQIEEDKNNIKPIESKGLDGQGELSSEQQKRLDSENLLNEKLKQTNREFAQEEVEIEKRKNAQILSDAQARVSNEIALQESVFNLAGILAEQGSKEAKAVAVAQVLFDTYKGIQATFASASANPASILFPGFPFVQAGLAAAFGFANVRKILSSPTKGGSAGGSTGSVPRGGSGSAPQRPQAVPNVDAINRGVGGQQNSQFSNLRAYIVQEDQKDEAALSQRLNDLQSA